LVHRDLKPANILVHSNGNRGREIKLTDFGLATKSGLGEEPGRISGSLPYVSPEAILGMPVDGRADLYGLGIALYYLSTGRLPSQGETADELLRWHLGGLPADPRRVRPRFPARLARFIRRLTARDRGERFAGAGEALSLLGVPVSDENGPPTIADRGERARLRLALDATRLGAARLFRLPGSRRRAEPLLREVRVWSQVHGLRFHRVRSSSERGLLPLVMCLLLDLGDGMEQPVRKYSLHRRLPLGIISGCPVVDHTRNNGTPANGAARDIGGFILECSARKPLALRIEGRPRQDTLLGSLIEELRTAIPSSRGLLLLLDE
jgi:serine/threonine-protein kinase